MAQKTQFTVANHIGQTIVDYLNPKEDKELTYRREIVSSIFRKTELQTASKSAQVFWSLEERWWMVLFDGKQHHFGPDVFDEARHGKHEEPGYFASIKDAIEFATSKPIAELTVEFYLEVHKKACAHFNALPGTGTLIKAKDTGKIFSKRESGRPVEKMCPGTPLSLFYTYPDYPSIKETYAAQAKKLDHFLPHEESVQWMAEFKEKARPKVEAVNAYIAERSRLLGASKPIAVLYFAEGNKLHLDYQILDDDELQRLTKALFKEFNENIAKAKSKDEKINLIADLYQMVEWLHPVPDGQGRNDLIHLAILLSNHGILPPILEEPYASTFCLPDDWIAYVKQGIQRSEQEFANLGRPLPPFENPFPEEEEADSEFTVTADEIQRLQALMASFKPIMHSED